MTPDQAAAVLAARHLPAAVTAIRPHLADTDRSETAAIRTARAALDAITPGIALALAAKAALLADQTAEIADLRDQLATADHTHDGLRAALRTTRRRIRHLGSDLDRAVVLAWPVPGGLVRAAPDPDQPGQWAVDLTNGTDTSRHSTHPTRARAAGHARRLAAALTGKTAALQ